ncbi:MAG: SH3 domain-containing protein, partial [Clostridia bacterium]|nr:SH3 domain-containing protein [Clostridia bacterium]
GLRVSPNKTAKSIRRLAAGDVLQVIATGKTWSKVVDPATGRTGYVANDYMVRQ